MDFSTDDWTQLDIYDWLRQPYSIQKPIRLIELFAGVGSQNMALKELQDEGICTYEAYRVCEFDKFAMDAYNSIHNTNFEASDICDWHGSDLGIVDKEKYTYICFYSFPCTDLSCAGKMLGMEEGSGTRSSLLWEVKRLLDETDELPQVLIMENVPMIHNDANRPNLQKWVDYLDSKGYCTYIDDIQAYDQGVPQSRNRTFAISILGSYKFNFPRPKPLEIDASDLLEDEVDESLYLTTDAAKKCIDDMVIGGRLPRQTDRQTDKLTDLDGLERMSMADIKAMPCMDSEEECCRQSMQHNTSHQQSLLRSRKYKKTVILENIARKDKAAQIRDSKAATTLLARDHKGISNFCNGVLEWEQIN